jgi:glycosyl transferase family 25
MNAPSSVFAALNQYFDKIYVITLEGCDDRQDSIKSHFSGLNYSFWPGTDKRKLPSNVQNDPSLYDDAMHKNTKRTSRSMSLGEYACACSHRSIYEDVVANNYERVLIFEDDAIPLLGRLSEFSVEMATLPSDWDVVLFDYYDHQLPSFKTSLKQSIYRLYQALHIANWHKVSPTLLSHLPMREFNEYFYLPGKLSGAHAYAVSNKAAKAYVEYQTPVILQADRIFYYYSQYKTLKEFALKDAMFGRGEVSEISTIGVHNPEKKAF